jgi:hypothetical protein
MGNERPAVDLSETESAVEPHCALVLLKADQAQPRESMRYRLLLRGREKPCADAAVAMFRKNGNARDEKAAIVRSSTKGRRAGSAFRSSGPSRSPTGNEFSMPTVVFASSAMKQFS